MGFVSDNQDGVVEIGEGGGYIHKDIPVFHAGVLMFHHLEHEESVVDPQNLSYPVEPDLAHTVDEVQTDVCG